MKLKEEILNIYDKDELRNIYQNGCINGAASCHVYYMQTVAAYERHEEEIWDVIVSLAQGCGCSPLEFLCHLKGFNKVYSPTEFKNFLVWCCIEQIALEAVLENEEN